ncbi:MAG TPA: RHS repeat-associated core domain-containing protein, partial [Longimicrobium sp.]|nr:RHS repeat-associated core domain-containing protein [Longimicrobium sp.]
TAVTHPGGAQDRYFYHDTTGALRRVLDRGGLEFTFAHDRLGRPISTRMPGQVVDTVRYDLDGREEWRSESGPQAGLLNGYTKRYDARGKLRFVDNGGSGYSQWYSGLGNLVATDWDNVLDQDRVSEQYVMDALGNMRFRKTSYVGAEAIGVEFPEWDFAYAPEVGRLLWSAKRTPFWQDTAAYGPTQDDVQREYDVGGNVRAGMEEDWASSTGQFGKVGVQSRRETRSFYGADEKLRVFQEIEVRNIGAGYDNRGVWEEYRYDALGRRVLVRTNRADLCASQQDDCTSSITRFGWSGDEIIRELRGPGGDDVPLETATGTAQEYGAVSYTHAGGIDRPLSIHKDGLTSIIPHQNWRGLFSNGTKPDGTLACPPGGPCIAIAWPGWQTTAWHAKPKSGAPQSRLWMGSLVDEKRDESGQLYMRNRYYDPATGQFTQADPIGIAGGLNSYGFADGDPVSYGDPYGLQPGACPPCERNPFGAALSPAQASQIAAHVGQRLRPVAPALRAAFDMLLFVSPDPSGELAFGMMILSRAGRHGDDAAELAVDVVRGKSLPGSVSKGFKTDAHHAFSRIIDNYADDASVFTIPTRGPGGQVVGHAELRQLKGSLNGEDGVFEWIVDRGEVTHRRFIRGGDITGAPNQVVKK